MKFSGKMCLMIILKVTKKQGFTLPLEDTFFEKPQGKGGGQIHRGGQIDRLPPSPPAFLGLTFDYVENLRGLVGFNSIKEKSCYKNVLFHYFCQPSLVFYLNLLLQLQLEKERL